MTWHFCLPNSSLSRLEPVSPNSQLLDARSNHPVLSAPLIPTAAGMRSTRNARWKQRQMRNQSAGFRAHGLEEYHQSAPLSRSLPLRMSTWATGSVWLEPRMGCGRRMGGVLRVGNGTWWLGMGNWWCWMRSWRMLEPMNVWEIILFLLEQELLFMVMSFNKKFNWKNHEKLYFFAAMKLIVEKLQKNDRKQIGGRVFYLSAATPFFVSLHQCFRLGRHKKTVAEVSFFRGHMFFNFHFLRNNMHFLWIFLDLALAAKSGKNRWPSFHFYTATKLEISIFSRKKKNFHKCFWIELGNFFVKKRKKNRWPSFQQKCSNFFLLQKTVPARQVSPNIVRANVNGARKPMPIRQHSIFGVTPIRRMFSARPIHRVLIEQS